MPNNILIKKIKNFKMKKIEDFFEYLNANFDKPKVGFDLINIEDENSVYDELHLRIYHCKGYCIDLYKTWNFEEREYEYEYHSELFEGFTPISFNEFSNLILKEWKI